MEQIRQILGWLKVNHFWVLLVLVLGLSSGFWYMGSSSVAKSFASGKSKIEKEFSSQRNLVSQEFKPNDSINEKQNEETLAQTKETLSIWSKLYDRQTSGALKWPEELGPAFLAKIAKLEFGDKIPTRERDRYQNYIEGIFDDLIEIIDAKDLGGGGRGGVSGLGGFGSGTMMLEGMESGMEGSMLGGRNDEVEPTHKVDWLDQDTVRQKLYFSKRPRSVEIWVTQEDLWVYETMLRAIAQTNEASGARRHSRMPIQTIYEFQVGQQAASQNDSSNRIYIPDTTSSGGGEFGGFGDRGGDFGFSGGGGDFGMERGFGSEGFGSGGEDNVLVGRYLDETGKPISTVTEGDFSFGVEYKRLPIRMVLEMEEVWIPTLIERLANAPLQIEVEQVRVNPQDGSRSSRGGGSNFGGIGGSRDLEAFNRNPGLGQVNIQGNVYIFNKPDQSLLSTDEVSEQF